MTVQPETNFKFKRNEKKNYRQIQQPMTGGGK